MLRSTILALAATAGLIGTTEFAGSTASASGGIKIGVGVYVPVYKPYCPPVVVYPRPTVVYSSPIIVTPAYSVFDVYYRESPSTPWRLYGSYTTPTRAQEAMDALQFRGFMVMETQR
ncbi:MAG TPA: hypothetical protein VE988_23745 [Gemmataceae bacterium]|nr:hypothetical protein [Gemmataceae bacterium]